MSTSEMTKERRAIVAQKYYEFIKKQYSDDIVHSIKNTTIYREDAKFQLPEKPKYEKTYVRMRNLTTEACMNLFDMGDRHIAVLNFSDYVKPAGLFLKGSLAQEESLCHHSILCPVLEDFTYQFYARNKTDGLLNGMYRNRMLYSKDILFFLPDKQVKADVITCAAPNFLTGFRYGTVSREHCNEVMKDRLDYIFRAAIANDVNILFLGAYGCGVFRNDPYFVASEMKKLCEKYEGYIEFVVFPVPRGGRNPENYTAFTGEFFGYRMSDI